MALLPGHIQYISPVFVGYFSFLFFYQLLVSAKEKHPEEAEEHGRSWPARAIYVLLRTKARNYFSGADMCRFAAELFTSC